MFAIWEYFWTATCPWRLTCRGLYPVLQLCDRYAASVVPSVSQFYSLSSPRWCCRRSRLQYVAIDNVPSTISNINCGVPQGSALGPLLVTVGSDVVLETKVLVSRRREDKK